jgi:hypothetical protein
LGALVLLLALPSASEGSEGIRVGLKAGWPWSWISYDDSRGRQDTDTDTRILSGGPVLELPFGDSDHMTVVMGATYVVRSGAAQGVELARVPDDTDSLRTADWTYYCVAVPLLVKYSATTGQLTPYVAGGVEMGIPLMGEMTTSATPSGGGTTVAVVKDITDDMRVVEFSLAAAVGVDLPLGSWAGFVEIMYEHGLTDVWKDDRGEVRYRTLTLSGGIMF